jgi:arylsulfatase A-like enzyme
VGIQHEAPDAAMIGYDEILSTPSARARHVAPAAVEFLSRRPEEPFFLSVGFFETHREWTDDSASADARYIRPPAPLPDAPETRRDFARFAHDAGVLDAGMGAVLDALDRAGLADRTLVLCTTDHGIAFPRMKCHLHDTGTGVMLLLRGPGGFSGGRSIDAMVSHLDILPTLCELLGLDASPEFQGKSLLPLVQGRADRLHEELFAEVNYHAAYEPMRAVRTGRWKYIRRYDDRSRPVLPNCDDGESKSFLLRLGMADWREEAELLYDLVRDPCEMNNLAGQPEYSPVQADMKRRLDEWMHRTDDPILRGLPVPAPRGAKVNNPDGASPCEPPVTIM